jgi:hypothetical protein
LKVVNLYNHPVTVKINTPTGVSYIHLAHRGRADLHDGAYVDNNFLVMNPKVKVLGQEAQEQPQQVMAKIHKSEPHATIKGA